MVLASATVDQIGHHTWAVLVWGQPPHATDRVYTIEAPSDSVAAERGIRRFVAEMERLNGGQPKG